MVVTRFAPSPTGDPHIGNIRSALFAYLFAVSQGGKFLLRIEDTDRERYVESSIQTIKDALLWLGVAPENIDEPMVQSERLDIYTKATLGLVEKGHAYVCTCSKERLEEVRAKQKSLGRPPRYDGHCRRELRIKNEELRANGIPENAVVRMKIPQTGKIVVDDLVRRKVEFDFSALDDQVILKSDGFPTYHLASVVDDLEMKVTHVIRAEEWLPSTPKHILLYEMLGFKDKTPKFAHLPIILSPNHGKLSKRDGAVGIMEYKRLGYLPEAIINFIALLGWNPKTEEEYFNLSDLEKRFKIEQVNKSAAVFDVNKLNHFNDHYLREKTPNELKKLLSSHTRVQPLQARVEPSDREIGLLLRGGHNTLEEMLKNIVKLRQEPKIDPQKLVFKKSTVEATAKALELVVPELEKVGNWSQEQVKIILENIVSRNNLSNGDVFWPVRYALSGEEKSPPPEELADALGKEKTVLRVKKAKMSLN